MPKAAASLTGTHSVLAGEFEQVQAKFELSHEEWKELAQQLLLKPDDVERQAEVRDAVRAQEAARGAVVDWLHQFAESVAGPSVTHDRVAVRIRLLAQRWKNRSTAIESPNKWDRGVWETQYQFVAAVEVATGEPDAEARLLEILGRFPEDFVSVRKMRQAPAAVREEEAAEPQYVTLDQIAALVSRKKRTLEHYKPGEYKGDGDPLPDPNVKGGRGKPDEWIYPGSIKLWLEATFDRKLPDHLTEPFRAGAGRG